MSYLNVKEAQSAIFSLSETYPDLSKVIDLPNKSIEGREIQALLIGKNKDDISKNSVLFTGSVHAREWGGTDICVYFAADILEAYSKGTGLKYGNQYFEARQIKKTVDDLNLILLPVVNPDGKDYSQSDPNSRLWRGNRNLNNSECFGVDINRNYDLLWDFRNFFSADALVATSDDPCDSRQTYRGDSAFSEPETRNVRWLFEEYKGIRYYVDIHCAIGAIYYCWGIDQNQMTDPEMNLVNPYYNGKRGVEDDHYGEYVPSQDHDQAKYLATSFSDALKAVRGTVYTVGQSFDLYATSGAGDDYAYSRHIVENKKNKIFGFTVEFGKDDFQPPWEEMERIIVEVSSGMLALCYSATKNTGV
jgi:murein tripeptide amidase MpaA